MLSWSKREDSLFPCVDCSSSTAKPSYAVSIAFWKLSLYGSTFFRKSFGGNGNFSFVGNGGGRSTDRDDDDGGGALFLVGGTTKEGLDGTLVLNNFVFFAAGADETSCCLLFPFFLFFILLLIAMLNEQIKLSLLMLVMRSVSLSE